MCAANVGWQFRVSIFPLLSVLDLLIDHGLVYLKLNSPRQNLTSQHLIVSLEGGIEPNASAELWAASSAGC